ncbi:MAG: ABC transporter permease [Erysipelotrichaceae bacterium]|nr:ABC transporter permease [Erysipelotrichaceae bacterium]
MFHKDTLRLIKKTIRRFFTIFLMVFIGVAFMVGVLSTHSIMKKSVDIYFDEYNFMDVQLYSSYGFDEEDVETIRNASVVEDVFASKYVDVYGEQKENIFVTRVQELDTNVNQFELLSGRLPENDQEAVTLGSSSFGVVYEEGEVVRLYLEEDEVTDSLKYEEYTIVGTVRTGQYMASTKEPSNLENLNLEAVIFVDNDDFIADYYTSMYLTLHGAKDLVAFTDDYLEHVEKQLDALQKVIDGQQEHRKQGIIEEIEEEIADGERELEEATIEAYEELDKAQKELDDGYKELLKAEIQIQLAEQEIETGEKQIKENREKLEDGKKEVDDAVKEVETESGQSFEETIEEIEALYMVYVGIESIVEEIGNEDTTITEQIDTNKAEISKLEEERNEYRQQLVQLRLNGGTEEEIAECEAKIEELDEDISNLQTQNTFLQSIITMYENGTFESILDMIDEMANGDVKGTYEDLKKLETAKLEVENGIKQLEQAEKDLISGKKQIQDAKKELEKGTKEYEDGVKEFNDAKIEVEEELEKARIDLAKARQDLDELPDAKWMVLDRDSHYSTAMYAGSANQMKTIGEIVPLLFFLVAALVCMTTMMRLIDEERSQMGIFSALGFSKGKIISKYVIYACIASVLGSLVGVFAGIPIFPNVIYWAWKLMYDTPEVYLYLPLEAALIGTLSFTILMMVVSYFVARKSLQQVPSQLMRPKAPKSTKKVFLENIPFIWNRLSFTSKVTARNLIRYKSRFFMTVIGVAGCTSLLVLGFGIKDSIAAVIDVQYSEILLHNQVVVVEEAKYTDDIVKVLEADREYELVAPYMNYASKVYFADEDTTIDVHVLNEAYDDIVCLRNRKTKEELSLDDGVVISEKFAKNHGLSVGDSLKIESNNGIKATVEINGICEMYFQHYLFMTTDYYEEMFDETANEDRIAIYAENNESIFDTLAETEGVKNILDYSEAKLTFTTMIEALDLIVVVILLAAGSLAFVVLMNLSEVNISERMREIATLKVLGFNNKEVNSYIFKEILLLSLIGAIVGMPLGKLELILVMNIIDMDMVMFGTAIEPLSYVYGFVITMVFAVLVLFFMRGSLRKVQMVESLKSVE